MEGGRDYGVLLLVVVVAAVKEAITPQQGHAIA